MRQQFLKAQCEPPLKWPVSFQRYEDDLLKTGLDTDAEDRKMAFLRSSIGTEGYRICAELCPPGTNYDQTVELLKNRFAPQPSAIFARSQFNRRVQQNSENSLQFVTELRTLAARCSYPNDIRDELIRDRFVAGCSNARLRERLLLEPDNLTLNDALKLAQNFERASTESSKVNTSKLEPEVQVLRKSRTPSRNPKKNSMQSNSFDQQNSLH